MEYQSDEFHVLPEASRHRWAGPPLHIHLIVRISFGGCVSSCVSLHFFSPLGGSLQPDKTSCQDEGM